MNPLLISDFYKISHPFMYPEGITKIYSNLTPRKSRLPGVNSMIFFGLQYFIKDFLIDKFNRGFFARPIEEVISEYKSVVEPSTGPLPSYQHIENLHRLGYLPIEIKALKEGTKVPMGVPCLTITNTHPEFAWLTNFIETALCAYIWKPCTSATLANLYKEIFDKYADDTGADKNAVLFQGHDFSMRGMSSVDSAASSGMGHLLSFCGTDTIPAILFAKKYYNAQGAVGYSVPASEHSVMCAGSKEAEIETFERLIFKQFPTGIISVVSDTWDLWKVLTEFLPKLKDKVLARDGKVVIRPDSGDPIKILCGSAFDIGSEIEHLSGTLKKFIFDSGYPFVRTPSGKYYDIRINQPREVEYMPEHKGVIEILWDVFGGTINEKGFKVLDPHIGAIYGDSITLERAREICNILSLKGFASTNWVAGIGSYTYQYNTRDTFGMAVKATYVEINGVGQEIFKDPITDDGTKRSAKGLVSVLKDTNNKLILKDQCNKEQEQSGELELVFQRGSLVREQSLEQIREIVAQ